MRRMKLTIIHANIAKFVFKSRRLQIGVLGRERIESCGQEHMWDWVLLVSLSGSLRFVKLSALFCLPPSYSLPFLHHPSCFLELSPFFPSFLFSVYFWQWWKLVHNSPHNSSVFLYLVPSQSWGPQLFKTAKRHPDVHAYILAGPLCMKPAALHNVESMVQGRKTS